MRYQIRPLGEWIGPRTLDRRPSGTFRAPWKDTLELLARETEQLGADLVVVQCEAREQDIRLDGMLRANALVVFPGVRVSFESRYGPLTYATDVFGRVYAGDPPGWQANVRAIALSLEKLRAVDRYGVTRRGEQYSGWRAIEAPSRAAPKMTDVEAAEFIAAHAGSKWKDLGVLVRTDPRARKAAFKAALQALTADRGGDHDQAARLNIARDILDGRRP